MVFVPFRALLDFPDDSGEMSIEEIRRWWDICQTLRHIRYQRKIQGKAGWSEDKPEGEEDPEAIHIPADATARDAALALIRRKVVRHRPEKSWTDIAELCGMTIRTLWKRRADAFPPGHKYHPESGDVDEHAKDS